MLPRSEHVHLPIDETWFQRSLTETIVWCTGLPIENDPYETPEVRLRRELGSKAGEMYRRAHLSNWPEFIKKIQYRRARGMFARSRLQEIAPLDGQLRSFPLQPMRFLPRQSVEEHREIVNAVVMRRAAILQSEARVPINPGSELKAGRLLLFAPSETLSDGAARYASKGFFDDDNVPAWDTWIAYLENYVVSWVPPQLIELVNDGVDANPERCILWA